MQIPIREEGRPEVAVQDVLQHGLEAYQRASSCRPRGSREKMGAYVDVQVLALHCVVSMRHDQLPDPRELARAALLFALALALKRPSRDARRRPVKILPIVGFDRGRADLAREGGGWLDGGGG